MQKSRLQQRYDKEALPKLMAEFGFSNTHQVPRIQKVVINVGVGRAVADSKALELATNTLKKITGRVPLQTKAKASIAGFKLRMGQKIGLKVTLRRAYMWEFLDRLISIVLPRTRDFRGLSRKAFDKDGNFSIGISDQSVFPELTYEDTTFTHGLQVNIITDKTDREVSIRLLELLGFPLEHAKTSPRAEGEPSAMAKAGAGVKV